jgi:hypothetical protein
MATLIFILILLSIFHYLYDSILLPTYRLELRYELFKYRDELIELKSNQTDLINDQVFALVYNSINFSMNRLSNLTLSNMYHYKRELDKNPELKQKNDNLVQMIFDCKSEELNMLYRKISLVSLKAFALNMGSWFIYFIPVVLVLLIIAYIVVQISRKTLGIRRFFRELTVDSKYKFTEEDNYVFC